MNIIHSLLILQKALLHPFDPCEVEVNEDTLTEVSMTTWASLQYHPETKADHKKTVLQLLEEGFAVSDDQILNEKIVRLSEDPKCWFHGFTTPSERKQWTYTITDSLELIQPEKRESRFYNAGENTQDLVSDSFWRLFSGMFDTATEIDLSEIQSPQAPLPRSEEWRIQWLGHSTTLIQVAGLNLLLDPLFGDVRLYNTIPLFLRYTPPGIALEDLPLIDAVLFSHSHPDHCDLHAMKTLQPLQPDIFTPIKLGKQFQEMGFKHVHDHAWWSSSTTDSVEICCTPARHWSCRDGNSDANESLWNGWIIKSKGQTLYFAGDTAYDEEMFGQINEEFGPIDILLMPISPEEEEHAHVNLKQALDATRLLHPKKMIPIHWGTLRTDAQKIEDPLLNLQAHLENDYIDLKDVVHILKIGEGLELVTPPVIDKRLIGPPIKEEDIKEPQQIEEKDENSLDRSKRVHRNPSIAAAKAKRAPYYRSCAQRKKITGSLKPRSF